MALEAVWPLLLCTRTKVILSSRSSPLVSPDDHPLSPPLVPFFHARLLFSGLFLVGEGIDSDTLFLVAWS